MSLRAEQERTTPKGLLLEPSLTDSMSLWVEPASTTPKALLVEPSLTDSMWFMLLRAEGRQIRMHLTVLVGSDNPWGRPPTKDGNMQTAFTGLAAPRALVPWSEL